MICRERCSVGPQEVLNWDHKRCSVRATERCLVGATDVLLGPQRGDVLGPQMSAFGMKMRDEN